MSKSATNTEDDENWTELGFDDATLQSLLDNPLQKSETSNLRDGENHMGFDSNMGDTWIYPNNLPCRSYQKSIVQAALYRNTLVVLPTGLGKTFIAAVVMYNFYRWYPRGKIIFMAPTRPLVSQQIEACQKIMPFPNKDTIELTGKLQKSKRSEIWKTKRVFFATPQVVQSDISGVCQQDADSVDECSFQDDGQTNKTDFPFDLVKLIVIDEAHKAKGKYAYAEVTQALYRHTKYFRVLALSATPGRTMEDVAEVCRNLLISHIEVRWDSSIDVLPYVHKKSMETVVVSLSDQIKEIREQLLLIVDPYLRQLTEAGVLSGSLTNINRNFLLYEQKRYRDRSFHSGRHPQHSAVISNFAICISLYHALELLERHGLRVFLNYYEEDEDGKNKFVLQMDHRLNKLVENLRKEVGPNPFEVSAAPMTNGKIAEIPRDLDFGHPKFEKTRECVLKHFGNNEDSRAIIFCEYRESVMLIYRMLLQHVPLLKPRCFVGQGGTGTLRALTQKQQIQIMNDFRSGKSNILVATSIGEEGIDVGEVELIVCFDISTSNPMRFVQRIGRTGREKSGHVIMMVTEGKEQQLLREVLTNKDHINKKLLKSSVVQQSLYKHAPRLVPTEFKPKCVPTFIKPPTPDYEGIPSVKGKKVSSRKLKTTEKVGQDLRKFFQNKTREFDKEDLEFFENDTDLTQAKPGVQTQQAMIKKLDKMKNLFTDLQSPIASQTQKSMQNTQVKVNNNGSSIKDFFKDSTVKNKTNRGSLNKSFNGSPTSNNSSHYTIDLCDEENEEKHIIAEKEIPASKRIDPERISKLKKFLSTTFTTTEVLKRAEISDLGYHLKSKDLSREMKTFLLKMRPEYIKENLEQMQVLNALYENETASYSDEEKTIREINDVILELFGGVDKVENFLENLTFEKYKQKCLDSDSGSEEEEDPEEMDNFQKKLDGILAGYGDGKRHDNYDWIQKRLKETVFYKDILKTKALANVQESMVYEALAEPAEEINNFDDYSVMESKYYTQWPEFNKTDIPFKSTPVQDGYKVSMKTGDTIKKTCLLNKFEGAREEYEVDEKKNEVLNSSTDSKQIQNMLQILEHKLKDNTLNETNGEFPHDDLEELETAFKIKRQAYETRMLEAESKIISTDNFEDASLPDEDDLIMAAAEAELKYSQTHLQVDNKNAATFLKDANETPDLLNLINHKSLTKYGSSLTTKATSSFLNSTPNLEVNSKHLGNLGKSSLATSPKLSLQQELDVDMEAFLDPFPEEQELLETNKPCIKQESFKENLTASSSVIVRESPDLFAEEHIRPIIKQPKICRTASLASKLSAKLNTRKCQTFLNPVEATRSPPKSLFNTQNYKELLKSPNHLPIDKQKFEKSPSLFDMYLKNTKGKGKLPKSLANSLTLRPAVNVTNNMSQPLKDSPISPVSTRLNESSIVIRNRNIKASKRKIFDSDSDQEEVNPQLSNLSSVASKIAEKDESDVEITATQRLHKNRNIRQRRKRQRFNSFIEHEAEVSRVDHSDDEDDHTIGCYEYDSVVVSSDDEDPDQASTSHMQAMYLQSLKSPRERRGAFKIPAPRIYNDHSRIFSQAVLPEETYSQYLPDSFVVEEEDNLGATEVSMCPLERAEKILKQRRRAKKLGLLEENSVKGKTKSKRKIKIIEDSSEDEAFE